LSKIKAFHVAQRERRSPEELRCLGLSQIRAVREYHKALRRRRKAQHASNTRQERRNCSRNFWKYARNLLMMLAPVNVLPHHSAKKQPPITSMMFTAVSPNPSMPLHGYLIPTLHLPPSGLTVSYWKKLHMS